jgi:dUTPase
MDQGGDWRWLQSTAELQEQTYGYPVQEFPGHPAQAAKYLQWNTFAIYNELAELAYEFSWKPWATDGDFVNSERIVAEVVDIMHFLGNILTAVGIDDKDFWYQYRMKQRTNRIRAESGSYSAQKGGVGEGSDVT